jgi:Fic-DOC domain mobile mystery protein B
VTDLHDQPEDATPLDPDEIEGLIPTHIVNREQLNALEQENIIQAQFWLNGTRFKKINTEVMLRKLHKQMFGEVWKWAGTFRQTGKNIGVDAYQLAVELKNLCDDVDAWIEFSSYPNTEIAVRFHHRLVYIHLFPNGNGRHARLATDILLTKQLNEPMFTWGLGSGAKGCLEKAGEIRSNYIKALRKADAGDYSALMAFVAST